MTKTGIKSLPGPKGHPLVGNLFSLDLPNLHCQIEQWADEYGDVYRLNLGIFDQLVITRPSMIQEILNARPNGLIRNSKMNKIIREGGVNGVFNSELDDWKRHRQIVAKGLDVKHQKDFYPAMEPVLERLYRKWEQNAINGDVFDIQKDLLRFTVDVTCSLAFGYPMNTLEQKGGAIQDQMEKVFPMIFKRINMAVPWYKLYQTKEDRAFNEAVEEMNRLVDQFIESAKARLAADPSLKLNPPSVIESILVAAEEDENFTDKEVRGNLLTLLMAGEDTTAHTLTWMIYLLSQEPEVTAKIREESDVALGDERWAKGYEMNARMRYLEGAAFETMRFKPVAPILLFEALEDLELEGLQIPKGQRILTQYRHAALKDDYFSDAKSFNPERWMKESQCPVHTPSAFTAFGGGPRYCPGRNLAILEIRMVMSMLVKNFDVELITNFDEVKEIMAFTMMAGGYQVRLKKRT